MLKLLRLIDRCQAAGVALRPYRWWITAAFWAFWSFWVGAILGLTLYLAGGR